MLIIFCLPHIYSDTSWLVQTLVSLPKWRTLPPKRCFLHLRMYEWLVGTLLWHPKGLVWDSCSPKRYCTRHNNWICGCVVTEQLKFNFLWNLSNQGFRQMSYAIMVVTVSTLGIAIIVNALLTTPGAIVKAKWITVKTNRVATVPPAGDMLEGTSVMWVHCFVSVRCFSVRFQQSHCSLCALIQL